jgi:protein O-GlcNAc transferase
MTLPLADQVLQAKALGRDLLAQGRIGEAAAIFRRVLAVMPDDSGGWYELGRSLMGAARPDSAEAMFRHAMALKPEAAEAANGLAFSLFQRERHVAAIAALRLALRGRPEDPEFHANLAGVLRASGSLDEAARHARVAIALVPGLAAAHSNAAEIQVGLGDIAPARRSYRRALFVAPDLYATHRNLLLAMMYGSDLTPEEVFAENLRFVARFAPQPHKQPAFANPADPERKLTIGYVSSDFRLHSIARVVLPWFSACDRARFRLVAFSDVANPDAMTERIRSLFDDWHTCVGASDAEVAAAVRHAGVDVLVVLAGHFDGNRPLLAAHGPAPVVVSALDGLTSATAGIHYLIGDSTVTPRVPAERFGERLIRVPVLMGNMPIDGAPEVGPPPMLSRGHVTFGSFNNPSKITRETVRLWSQVLKAVPGSRLMLKYWNVFASPELCARILAMFGAEGIGPERLLMAEAGMAVGMGAHLAGYAEVDIALDTIPFNGSTTTFEALWMGVPVIALLGDTMMARWAASMLIRVGHPEWVTRDADEYVARAAQLGSDVGGLALHRQTLRAEVAASPVCDGMRAGRNLERVYRALWRRGCRSQAPARQS